ncbi:MAG: deoxyribonuclease IV [Candidatus Promineifilaceae bacterium]
MRFGAQMSTAGGLSYAFERGREAGCEALLIFTKSNRQWAAKPLSDEDVAAFKAAAAAHAGIHPVAVHASYLINVGSSDPDLWRRSYDSLKEELLRATALGAKTLTFHPGAAMQAGERAGLENVGRALRRLLAETPDDGATVCLETMAGTGTTLGHRFEQFAYLLEMATPPAGGRLGVCFDTCHVHSAGYDLVTAEGYAATLAEFERLIGLEHIRCFHFNDSKHKAGERKDRHEHIGRGQLGLEAFGHFVRDPRWVEHAAFLETPKEETAEDGTVTEMDPVNLAALIALRGEPETG